MRVLCRRLVCRSIIPGNWHSFLPALNGSRPGSSNLLDRRVLEAGLAGERDGREVEFHFRSIFLQGLLVMDDGLRPETFPVGSLSGAV